jgi:hypothetical protein
MIPPLDERRPWSGGRLANSGFDQVKFFVAHALKYTRAHDDPDFQRFGLAVVGVNSASACCDVMPDNVA